jgi:hypothetical protein
VVIFDFVHGQVVNSATNPQTLRDMLESAAKQAREIQVSAGGVPADAAA